MNAIDQREVYSVLGDVRGCNPLPSHDHESGSAKVVGTKWLAL